MNSYAGYVRVSTISQTDGVSLEMQESKIKSYVELQGGNLVGVFRDEGVSGTKDCRSGLGLLLQSIEEKKVSDVVVYSLSRLSRKTLHLLTLIEMFSHHDVKFHSITESINTATPQGAFFLTLVSALSQLERDQISHRTKEALQFKRSNGEKCGGQCPYGFTSEDGKLIDNPCEMEVVNKVLEWRKEGQTYSKISHKLSEHGFKSRTGNGFHPETIRNILTYHNNIFQQSNEC